MFEEPKLIRPFKDELAAVAAGTKPLSCACISDEWLWTGRSTADLDRAWALGLVAIIVPGEAVRTPKHRFRNLNLYITRREHAWRVFAHEHLWETTRFAQHWNTQQLEAQESSLFGYPQDAIDAWLAWRRNSSPERGMSLYLLLTNAQRKALDALGMRCLTPDAIGNGMRAFSVTRHYVPRRDAQKRCAPLQLARFGMLGMDIQRLLFAYDSGWKPRPRTRLITADEATAINKAMLTKIELWNGKRWT